MKDEEQPVLDADGCRTEHITFYKNWYLLAQNRDTREKKLALLEAILDYAFTGKTPDYEYKDDGGAGGKKMTGRSFAARDGFLAAQPVIDRQLENAEWGRRKKAKRIAEDGLDIEEPPAQKPAPSKRRKTAKKQSADDGRAEQPEEGDAEQKPDPADAPKQPEPQKPAAAPTPPTAPVDPNVEVEADGTRIVHIGNPNTQHCTVYKQNGVKYIIHEDDGGEHKAFDIPKELVVLKGRQMGIPDDYIEQWYRDMHQTGWTYMRGKETVHVKMGNFVSILKSFWRVEQKDRQDSATNTTVFRQNGYKNDKNGVETI